MSLTKQGIQFKYHGDILIWLWPWVRPAKKQVFLSKNYETTYLSLRDYWQCVGAHEQAIRSKKLEGHMNRDIVMDWVKLKYPDGITVVMRDINHNIKNSNFWKSVPSRYRVELLKDVIVLFFSDTDKALAMVNSMSVEFAECYMFYNKNLIASNLHDKSGLQRHEE